MTLVIKSITRNILFIGKLNIDPSDNPRFSELLSHRVFKNCHINHIQYYYFLLYLRTILYVEHYLHLHKVNYGYLCDKRTLYVITLCV